MPARRRKMIIGMSYDPYGNYCCSPREFVVIDIDSLKLQFVAESKLRNLEMNHNVNFMIMPDGDFRFLTPGTGLGRLTKYHNKCFIQGIPNNRYVLLGVVYDQNRPVGYNIYDCQLKKCIQVGVDGDTSLLKCLGNAEYVQQAFRGFIYGYDNYFRFNT